MARRYTLTPQDVQAVNNTAARLGVRPADLIAVMHYETIGTMNPTIEGGKGGRYQGLIQFGPSERRTYGYDADASFAEQVEGPVYRYLKDRGLPQGADLGTIYRTVNGGNPLAKLWKNDGNGTIAQHIERIKALSLPLAGDILQGVGPDVSAIMDVAGRYASEPAGADAPTALQGFAPSLPDASFAPAQDAIADMLAQPGDLTADQVDELTRTDVAGNYLNQPQSQPTQLPPQWDAVTGFPEQPRRPGPGGALGVDLGMEPAGMPVPPSRPGTFDWLGGGAPDAGLVPTPGISPLRPAMGGPGDRRPQPPTPPSRASGIPDPRMRPSGLQSLVGARPEFPGAMPPAPFISPVRGRQEVPGALPGARPSFDPLSSARMNLPPSDPRSVGSDLTPEQLGRVRELQGIGPYPARPEGQAAGMPAAPSPYDDPSRAFDDTLNYPVSRLAERSAPLPRQDFSLAGPGPTFTPSPPEHRSGEWFTPAPPMPAPLAEARMKDDVFSPSSGPYFSNADPGPTFTPPSDLPGRFEDAFAPGPTFTPPPSSAPAAMAGIEDVFGRTPAPAAVSNLAIPYDQVPGYNPPVTARPMPSYPARAGDTMLNKEGEPIFNINSVSGNGRTMLLRESPTNVSPLNDDDLAFGLSKGWQIERQAPMPQGREGDLLAEAYGLPRSPPPPPPPSISMADFGGRFDPAPPPIGRDDFNERWGPTQPTAATGEDIILPGTVPGAGSILPEDEPLIPSPNPMEQAIASAPISERYLRRTDPNRPGFLQRAAAQVFSPLFGPGGGGFIGPNGFFSNAGSFTPSGAGGTSFFNQQPGGAMGTTNWRHGSVTGNPNMQGTMWNRSGDNGSVGYVTDPFNPGTSMIYSGSPNRF